MQRADQHAQHEHQRRAQQPHHRWSSQDVLELAVLAAAACGATVRDTYGTPQASTYSTREAGTRSPYVQYGGPGVYVSA